jgi:hypothetical protein
MRRWTFRIVSLASLLLGIALSVLWSRSYRPVQTATGVRDSINLTKTDPHYWLISRPGQVTLCGQHGKNWNKPLQGHGALGFRFGGLWGDDGSLLWNASGPYWPVVTLTAILPLAHVGLYVRRRRRLGSRGFPPVFHDELQGLTATA